MRSSAPSPTLNIIQDIATPHNNSLIAALRARGDLRVVTWYAARKFKELPWKTDLGGPIDNYYFDHWAGRGRLAWHFLTHADEHYLVIGYINLVAQFILIASWLLRRPIMFWMDNPPEKQRSWARAGLNRTAHGLLRAVARPLFVVGDVPAQTFVKRFGFRPDHVVNLPIFIDLPALSIKDPAHLAAVRARYQVQAAQLFCVAASRLTREKGYDLLLAALQCLGPEYGARLRVLIVGVGPEEAELRRQVQERGLTQVVCFESWLEPGEYERILAAADVFIHPARFDAFGGGTLYAMALGLPVIGSDGAGSVVERVQDGVNGLVYAAEDVEQLAACLRRLSDQPAERELLGRQARMTAEAWHPRRGAEIVVAALGRRRA